MHVIVAGAYAVVIWLSVMAYCLMFGVPFLFFLAFSPIVISASMIAVIATSYAVRGLVWVCCWLWCWRVVKTD